MVGSFAPPPQKPPPLLDFWENMPEKQVIKFVWPNVDPVMYILCSSLITLISI